MEAFIGKTLNRYQIVELLGEGGMGAVFRGHDMTLQRDVAIKVMHPHLSRKSDFQERFLQEARTAARLNHPSIVAVYDFGQAQGMLYIVMEFIPGDNLRHLIQKLRSNNQWIPLVEAAGLITHIASALGYAHVNGILHRDIKPANIMLQPNPANGLSYRPILTDLGLAKLMETSGLTQEGTAIGTPPYMSPEQTLGEKTDSRADVYSLGILLYELSVGQLPFPIKTLTDAIRYHNHEHPPAPRTLAPKFPDNLETVILKAIAKAPEDRYQDADEFLKALELAVPPSEFSQPIPSAPAGEVSLLTLLSPREPHQSVHPAFPDPTQIADASIARVQVLNQAQDSYSLEIPIEGLQIGKGEDNQLILEDPNISQHHALIEIVEENIQVTDLNSTNGTWLGSQKLLPNQPEIWMPSAVIHLGDYWLRLLPPEGESLVESLGMIDSDGSRIDSDLVNTSQEEGWISAYLEEKTLTVSPGGSGQLGIKVLNQGPLVDHLRVAVQGVPDQWVNLEPSDLKLLPGEQSPATLTISPPKDSTSKAGIYPLTIQISSQNDPKQVVGIKGSLTVGAFARFKASLHPEKIRPGQIVRVTVENQGNSRESLTLKWQDRGDELSFSPPQTVLQVEEGQTTAAEFTAALTQLRVVGNQLSHPFSVDISSSQEETKKLQGELISRGLIPVWVIPVVVVLGVILASAAGLIYNQGQTRSRQSTQTAIAELTALPLISLAGDRDNDGLTDGDEAEYGTDPDLADTDNDGLIDSDEIELRSNPLEPDSDGDGLQDGAESQRGTNPLLKDTDGDTLTDGEEVNQGTNPRLPDTDGDGLPDNVDPAPLMTGTATPTPTATLLPTQTPTATPSPTPTPDISSEILAYYPFDSSFTDQSGNDFDATSYNQANCFSFVTDRRGFAERAAGFEICNNSPDPDYYFGLLLVPHIHFSRNFTISTWIWPLINSGTEEWIVGQANWDGLVLEGNTIRYRNTYMSEQPQIYISDSERTERETWVHYTLVVSGDGTASSIAFYRNGELTANQTIPEKVFDNPSSEEFLIGAALRDNAYSFAGGLDDLIVYNRALTAAEARFLFENDGRPPQP